MSRGKFEPATYSFLGMGFKESGLSTAVWLHLGKFFFTLGMPSKEGSIPEINCLFICKEGGCQNQPSSRHVKHHCFHHFSCQPFYEACFTRLQNSGRFWANNY